MLFFVIVGVIQVEGLCVYNMHKKVEKPLSISTASVQSRGGMLVKIKDKIIIIIVPLSH
jgi:hypothetical protein